MVNLRIQDMTHTGLPATKKVTAAIVEAVNAAQSCSAFTEDWDHFTESI